MVEYIFYFSYIAKKDIYYTVFVSNYKELKIMAISFFYWLIKIIYIIGSANYNISNIIVPKNYKTYTTFIETLLNYSENVYIKYK